MGKFNNKARKITLGSMVTLLSVVSLYIASVLPTNRLLFFALSSFFLAAIVIEDSIKFAILVHISSSLLSFIIVPNKIIILPFVIFFGYYAIVKSIVERINIIPLEWLLKILAYNSAMYIIYTVTSKALMGNIIINLPIWTMFLLMQLAFIIYDYSFSLSIYFYKTRIKKRI